MVCELKLLNWRNMKQKIFIVDDEVEIVEMVKLMLETKEFDTIEAYSGEMALETLRKLDQNEYPDLILLDIMMKPMNGWETLENIKKDENLKNIPVSMLTLVPLTPETMGKESIENIENYITKPFTKETLLNKVNAFIGVSKKFGNMHNLIKENEGEKLADEYKNLYERVSRHRFLLGALQKTAIIEGGESCLMRMTHDKEEKMINTLKRKMVDIEKKAEMI